MKSFLFFSLITLFIASNCFCRPQTFTERVKNTITEAANSTWHGSKKIFQSIFSRKPETTTIIPSKLKELYVSSSTFASSTIDDCFEVIDGICILEATPSPKELEEFEKITSSNIESRFIIALEEPCPDGFKRGSKGNCRKIARIEKATIATVLPLCVDKIRENPSFTGDCLANVTPTDDDYFELYENENENGHGSGSEDRNALSVSKPCPPGFQRDQKNNCRKKVFKG